MDLTISIPDEIASKLQVRAAEMGQTVPAYAAQIVAETVIKPTIDELLDPVRADFAKTGMSDAELLDFGREMLTAVRQEKKAKSG
jgi:plasmid stability protein